MGLPIATTQSGFICFAFPDVCNTPAAPNPVPIPYPNIGQLSAAKQTSDGSSGGAVKAAGHFVILAGHSFIQNTTGDEAGSLGGVKNGGVVAGKVDFTGGSATVKVNGKPVVRLGDPTEQNAGNAVGTVLGGVPNILVGG